MSGKRFGKTGLKDYGEEVSGEFKENLLELVLVIGIGAIGIAFLVLFCIMAEPFTAVENAILSESGFIGTWSFYIWAGIDALVVFVLLCMLAGAIKEIIKKMKHRNNDFVEQERKKGKQSEFAKKDIKIIVGIAAFVLIANVVLGYCAFTDVRIATDAEIIKRSPLDPVGNTYSYADVVSYEVLHEDGNPVLELKMNDNRKVKFGHSDMSSYIYDDQTECLCVIDSKLRDLDVEKKVMCTRDQFYWNSEDGERQLEQLLSKE